MSALTTALDCALQDSLTETGVACDVAIECQFPALNYGKQGFLRANNVLNRLSDLFICDMVTA